MLPELIAPPEYSTHYGLAWDFRGCIWVSKYQQPGSKSHQRQQNENTDWLLGRYFQQETDLADLSHASRNEVVRQLNGHTRKTQTYETPAKSFSQCVLSNG
jgi:IS30 family transposase